MTEFGGRIAVVTASSSPPDYSFGALLMRTGQSETPEGRGSRVRVSGTSHARGWRMGSMRPESADHIHRRLRGLGRRSRRRPVSFQHGRSRYGRGHHLRGKRQAICRGCIGCDSRVLEDSSGVLDPDCLCFAINGAWHILKMAGRQAIPCSAVAQQRHKIIRNGVALAGEESVSGVTRGSGRRTTGEPTHAHLHHRQ